LIRLYFCLLMALAAAVTVILAANASTGDRLAASLLGDAVFVSVLGSLIWRNAAMPLGSVGSVLAAVAAFIATGILLADIGGALYFSAPVVGRVLVHIFSIGYYPGGADAPFDLGAMLWALSMLVICALGLAIGAGLRVLRQSQA
jgi:hypothetical protein